MKYLIDTNILIWFIEENAKLPPDISEILNDDKTDIYISVISLWEISIKYSLGKLRLPRQLNEIFDEITDRDYFAILDIKPAHIIKQTTLPFYHRDPFDRLIYAQAKSEDMRFLYTDEIFNKYEKGV